MTQHDLNEMRRVAINAKASNHLYRDITGTHEVAELGDLIIQLTGYMEKNPLTPYGINLLEMSTPTILPNSEYPHPDALTDGMKESPEGRISKDEERWCEACADGEPEDSDKHHGPHTKQSQYNGDFDYLAGISSWS